MSRSDNTLDLMNLQLTDAEQEEQLIIFSVGEEEFGLDVLCVQEIIRYLKPTKIPHAPEFMEGVINFRGEVIPIISMRKRFGIDGLNTDNNVIIVIEHSGRVFGLTVDAVSDLQNLPKDKIQRRFDYTIEEKTKYLRAMGKMEDRLILIPDLEKIIDLDSEIIPEEIKQSINKEGGE
jgi:purine-binding chemotaxis protein CheW